MKGSEIVALWNKARKSVADIHGNPGGEIGDRLRGKGYAVSYDGCSVCNFMERHVHISYSADCCDRPWTLSRWLWIYPYIPDRRGNVEIDDILPDKEYEVVDDPSLAELFDAGRLDVTGEDGRMFVVSDNGGRECHEQHYFDSFERADEFARKFARETIDRLNRDPTWRRHTSHCVKNDALFAKERSELRHYRYYNCDGYRYWVSVRPVNYRIIPAGEKEGNESKEVA